MAAGGRLILKIFILSLLFLTGGSVFSFYSLLYEQNDVAESTVILVEKGDNLNKIAYRLKRDKLVNSAAVFKAAARLSGKSTALKAGEYRIPARASAKEILDILVTGQTTIRRVTIPEGKTSRQIFDILAQTAGLTGDLPEPPPNGMLLPETYVFSYGMPRKIIVDRMMSGMSKTIDELWPGRDNDLPYTTKEEALVLASIIEKETSVGSERSRIAGVFINRLRKGMRLQTDPTVIYAITNGTMELKRRLTHSDLQTPHPFNTYKNKGLPPAPICNPGRESIQAVLKPQKTNEIYFVADGTGGHSFARSFDEHRRNILKWKKVRRQKRQTAYMKKTGKTAQISDKKNEDKKAATVLSSTDALRSGKQEEVLEQQELSADIIEDMLEELPSDPVERVLSDSLIPADKEEADKPAETKSADALTVKEKADALMAKKSANASTAKKKSPQKNNAVRKRKKK